MTAVLRALEQAEHPVDELAEITLEAASLSEKKDLLLPVEEHAKNAITSRMKVLKEQAERIEFGQKTGLPMIPFDVLKWRVVQKVPSRFVSATVSLPQLALVSVTDKVPTIRFSSHEGMSHPGYPTSVARLYNDVYDSLLRAAGTDHRIAATYTFAGAIPQSVRESIQRVIDKAWFHSSIVDHTIANTQVYLLCESTPWHVERTKIPKPIESSLWDHLDPLVVGIAHDRLWLIDKFDPTPVEEYISIEFTERPALTA